MLNTRNAECYPIPFQGIEACFLNKTIEVYRNITSKHLLSLRLQKYIIVFYLAAFFQENNYHSFLKKESFWQHDYMFRMIKTFFAEDLKRVKIL